MRASRVWRGISLMRMNSIGWWMNGLSFPKDIYSFIWIGALMSSCDAHSPSLIIWLIFLLHVFILSHSETISIFHGKFNSGKNKVYRCGAVYQLIGFCCEYQNSPVHSTFQTLFKEFWYCLNEFRAIGQW